MIWSPFFGVSESGEKITGWMNRLLLTSELFVCVVGFSDMYMNDGGFNLVFMLTLAVVYLFLSAVHFVLWMVWRVLFVLWYGSADPEVIMAKLERRREKRERRKRAKISAIQQG